MSTATLEVTELDELTVIPCEAKIYSQPCGQEAAFRVIVRCPCATRDSRPIFVCKRCLELIKDGLMCCLSCHNNVVYMGVL